MTDVRTLRPRGSSGLSGRPGMRRRSSPGSAAPDDHGSSAIELAILAPMLLAMIWLTIQFALWYQGRQVALAAAQLGARVASQAAERVPDWAGRAERSDQD